MDKRTLILGIGNVLLGDEGVGVHVVRELQKRKLPAFVEVLDGGTAGFELISHFAGKDKVVIIDAVNLDAEPGSIVRFRPEDLATRESIPFSAHEGGVTELLASVPGMNLPPEVVLYGVVPQDIDLLRTSLSPAVESKIGKIVSLLVAECGGVTASEIPVAFENEGGSASLD